MAVCKIMWEDGEQNVYITSVVRHHRLDAVLIISRGLQYSIYLSGAAHVLIAPTTLI